MVKYNLLILHRCFFKVYKQSILMKANLLKRLMALIIPYLPNRFKPRIKGTWSEIVKQVNRFSSEPRLINTNGFLIRFTGVKKHYSTYYFTKENINKLIFRKREKYFMEPGDSGCHDLSDEWNYFWELLEIPANTSWEIDINDIRRHYRLNPAKHKQYKYY